MAPIMASFYIVSLLLIAPFAADAAFWSRRGVDSHRTMLVLQQPRGVLSQGARAVTNSCIHALNVIPAAWRLPERCQEAPKTCRVLEEVCACVLVCVSVCVRAP